MSINVANKTVTGGLVFEYDTGNQKSYLGKVTTNQIGSQSLAYTIYAYVDSPIIVTTDDQFRNQRSTNRYNINAVTGSARGMFTPTISLNTNYTVGMYMRYNGTQSASPNFVLSAAKTFPEASGSITLSQNTATFSQSLANNWWYVWYNFNASQNSNPACILTFGLNANLDLTYINKTFDVYNPQIEAWPVPTPYTVNFRDYTSSLFDLAYGKTVNMISANFDTASSTPYFSGSNSLIINNSGSAPSRVSGSQWTWDFWFRSTSNGGYRPLYSTSTPSDPLGFSGLFFNPSSFAFRLNAGSGSAITGSDLQVDKTFTHPTVNVGTYYNATLTYHSASGFFFYLNGAYYDSASWSSSLGFSSTNTTIGSFWAGGWSGDIPVHKQYNRALAPTEVKANYDALRSRFGL